MSGMGWPGTSLQTEAIVLKETTMPTNIRIIHAHEFILATPEGELDREKTRKLLMEIASAAASLADYEIILDFRKAECTMSATDLWYLVADLGNLRQAFSRKTAVLCPLGRCDHAEFFALCAQNRGFHVRAFSAFEEAIEWLVADGLDTSQEP
jgi:hypothetical protein